MQTASFVLFFILIQGSVSLTWLALQQHPKVIKNEDFFPESEEAPDDGIVGHLGMIGTQTIYPRQWEDELSTTTTKPSTIEDEDGKVIKIKESPLIARLLASSRRN